MSEAPTGARVRRVPARPTWPEFLSRAGDGRPVAPAGRAAPHGRRRCAASSTGCTAAPRPTTSWPRWPTSSSAGRAARRLPGRVALRGLRRVAAGGPRPPRLLRPQPDAGAGQPPGPAHRAVGRRRRHAGPGHVRLRLRGAARLRARRLRRGRVRRGAGLDPVAGRAAGHDRQADRRLPQPHAAAHRAALRGPGRSRCTGRKTFTHGTLHAGDRLCAEGEGLFVAIDFSKVADMQRRRDEAFGPDQARGIRA